MQDRVELTSPNAHRWINKNQPNTASYTPNPHHEVIVRHHPVRNGNTFVIAGRR